MYFTHAKNYLIHRKYPQYFSKNLYIKNYCHLNFQVLSYPINIHGNLVASVCVIPSGYFFHIVERLSIRIEARQNGEGRGGWLSRKT